MDAQKLEMIDIGETEVRKPVHRKRQLTRAEKLRRKKRRRRARIIRGTMLIVIFLLVIGVIFGIVRLTAFLYGELSKTESMQVISDTALETLPEQDNRKWKDFYGAPLERPELLVDLLTVNEYSRPGEPLPEVKNIFVHYTANAGTTAQQNRSYFQSLAETGNVRQVPILSSVMTEKSYSAFPLRKLDMR